MIRRLMTTLLLLALPATPAAARTTLKLATLAPDGSVWQTGLMEMGEQWKQATGGEGTLRVYSGGVAGDEPDMVRKMRTGQLQAATLTISGLAQLDSAFAVFSMPLFYDSYDELWAVVDALDPLMRQRLEERGFVLVGWGVGGWVHFFTKTPVTRVDDLKKLKIFASAGDDRWVQLWKNRGFNPVPLAMTDIQTGLETGLIDGIPTTPLAALSLQWFRQVPYMLDTGITPLIGATVVTKAAWERMSDGERKALLDAGTSLDRRLRSEVPGQDKAAIVEMKKRGLTVTDALDDPEARQGWQRESKALADYMREKAVPAEIFDRAVAVRDAFRAEQQKK